MSYLVLARKYRPQTFEAVVQQDHVTRTLSNAIAADRVAHAILFSGPRGTGKTTIARILAKAMNCEGGPRCVPCNTCRSCKEITAGNAADVFEIDGASNNSVDQVRELRDNVKFMPAHSSYKIYIIDEVHMLSTAAFNALLKTLEEPPAHVLFFFATTESHKIPITILSRCQRHDLRRIDLKAVVAHLAELCEAESVTFTEESLWLIAREAGGSMRDALSLLDQMIASSDGAIRHDQVLDLLGAVDTGTLFEMSAAILASEVGRLLSVLDDAYTRGRDLKKLYADLVGHFRNLLVIRVAKDAVPLVHLSEQQIHVAREQIQSVSATQLSQILDVLMREEANIRFASQPRLALEVAFLRLGLLQPALPIETLITGLEALRTDFFSTPAGGGGDRPRPVHEAGRVAKPAATDTEPSQPSSRPFAQEPPPGGKPERPRTAEGPKPSDTGPVSLDSAWEDILNRISHDFPFLAPDLAESTAAAFSGDKLEIQICGTEFNLMRLQREKSRSILNEVCSAYFERPVKVQMSTRLTRCEENQNERDAVAKTRAEALAHPLVAESIEVFEGKVVDVRVLLKEG